MTVKRPKLYKPRSTNNPKKFYFEEKVTGRAKGYDKDWEAYRRRFLHYNPHCYCCNEKSNVVDHIKAHKQDQELFKDLSNHMPCCTLCHNTITGKFDRKDPPDLAGKIKWIKDKRRLLNVTRKIKVLPYYGGKKPRGG